MQNAVIGIIVGSTFLGLLLVALRSPRSGKGAIGLQLVLGVVVGALAAAIAVSVRADLVPDSIETAVSAAVITLATVGLVLIVARYRAR